MWEYFTEEELKCKGTDECDMDKSNLLSITNSSPVS